MTEISPCAQRMSPESSRRSAGAVGWKKRALSRISRLNPQEPAAARKCVSPNVLEVECSQNK